MNSTNGPSPPQISRMSAVVRALKLLMMLLVAVQGNVVRPSPLSAAGRADEPVPPVRNAAPTAQPLSVDQPFEGFIEVDDGIRLYCSLQGCTESTQPTLVIPFATLFADGDFAAIEESFRVLYYDMRGRGRSDSVSPTELSFEADVRDLETVRMAFNLETMNLLGVSMLGNVCLHYALDHPDRVERVVAVNPLPSRAVPYMNEAETPATSGRVPQHVLDTLTALAANGVHETDPVAFAQAYNRMQVPFTCAVSFNRAPEWALFPIRIPNEWAGNAAIACGSIVDTLGLWDWREEMSQLWIPVLVVYGTEDYMPTAAGAEELAEILPRGRLLVLQDAGHFAHVAAGESFSRPVISFLRDE